MPPIKKPQPKQPQWKPGTKVQGINSFLWKGPETNDGFGGITFSMLSRYLTCKERFRVRYLLGIKPIDKFNAKIEYGQMWHECEEAIASEVRHFGFHVGTTLVEDNLKSYAKKLCLKYRQDQSEINKWYEICKLQFDCYVNHWSQHQEYQSRTPVLAEKVFNIPYKIEGTNVTVYLQGKFDSVDVIKRKLDEHHYLILQENKTKGDYDVEDLKRQLKNDFQTMIYVTALQEAQKSKTVDWLTAEQKKIPIGGVRYNVVRRPLSGGRHSIRRHQATTKKPEESEHDFYVRLKELIKEDPEYFFTRFDVEVTQKDIERFKKEVLNPILINAVLWYRRQMKLPIIKEDVELFPLGLHWRHPYGVNNSVDEYGADVIDDYLDSGSMIGLTRTHELFTELQPKAD